MAGYSHNIYPCRYGRASRRSRTLLADYGHSGYLELPTSLTINGSTKTPTFVYYGEDADDTEWRAHVGEDLAIAGTGDAPVVDDYAPGIGDKRVAFRGGKKYARAASTLYDVGTDDIVCEMVFRMPTENLYAWAKDAESSRQYGVLCLSGATLYFGYSGLNCAVSATAGQWFHMLAVADKSGSMTLYRNGVQGGTTSISGVSASGDGGTFTIGAQLPTSATGSTLDIAYLAMWQGSAWLDTHLQADLAKERFHRICGIWPDLARGTEAPVLATRSTAGYIDKIDDSCSGRILVPVGVNWIRTVQRCSGDAQSGVLIEPARTNDFLYSEDMTQEDWVKTRAEISANAVTAPDGTTTAYGIIGGTANVTHYIGQSVGAADGQDLFSVWIKAGAQTWVHLQTSNVANGDAYFDLANGVVGTVGAGCEAGIQPWADDWYRCWISYASGVPEHDHNIIPAASDGADAYRGDGSTVDIYVWGAEHEKTTNDAPGSYVKTTTAAATYTADVLSYAGGDNLGGESNGKGTISLRKMSDPYGQGAVTTLATLNDGGSANDSIRLGIDADDKPTLTMTAGGVAQAAITGSTVMDDGVWHTLEASFQTDLVRLRVDGVIEGSDTSATIPDDLDRLTVGSNESGTGQPGVVISRLKIYSEAL